MKRNNAPAEAFRSYVRSALRNGAYLLEPAFQQRLEGWDRPYNPQAVTEARNAYNRAVLRAMDGYFKGRIQGHAPDEDQCRMAAVDEDRCLILAGAGTGKSSTLVEAVRYLIDPATEKDPDLAKARAGLLAALGMEEPEGDGRQGLAPEDILVLSYSNAAVDDLAGKFDPGAEADRAAIPVNVLKRGAQLEGAGVALSTFHALGLRILGQGKNSYNGDDRGLPTPVTDRLLKDWFFDPKRSAQLAFLFPRLFDNPELGEGESLYDYFWDKLDEEYPTLSSAMEAWEPYRRQGWTINGEKAESVTEARIADHLFLSGVKYSHERLFRGGIHTIEDSRKPYTPDFTFFRPDGTAVYYEHFGLAFHVRHDPTEEEREAWRKFGWQERYWEESVHKLAFLAENEPGSHLYTYGLRLVKGKQQPKAIEELLEELDGKLRRAGIPFPAAGPDDETVRETLLDRLMERQCLHRFYGLIQTFLNGFDSQGYPVEQFDAWLGQPGSPGAIRNDRTRLFLDICRDCYRDYHAYLNREDVQQLDFSEMINQATALLKNRRKKLPQLSRYRCIFVDEYQDISPARAEFLKALAERTGASLMAIGDDWQSIYAFSGAKVELFTDFYKSMDSEDRGELIFHTTYRNSQSLIDVAGAFIQQNEKQLKKDLMAAPGIPDIPRPIVLCTYDDGTDRQLGREARQEIQDDSVGRAMAAVLRGLRADGEALQKKGKPLDVLFLGRYNGNYYNDAEEFLTNSGLFVRGLTKEVRLLRPGQVNRLEKDGEEYWSYVGPDSKAVNKLFSFRFRTIHRSKGDQADLVVLLNGREEVYNGFPCQREDDPVLAPVLERDRSYPHAEERRLFYVALTRTRNKFYCLAPRQHPSQFLTELAEGIPLSGGGTTADKLLLWDGDAEAPEDGSPAPLLAGEDWNDEASVEQHPALCPLCGAPMQRLSMEGKGGRTAPGQLTQLFVCTNDQTACGFLTNDLRGGPMPMMAWESAPQGFLVVGNGGKTLLCPDRSGDYLYRDALQRRRREAGMPIPDGKFLPQGVLDTANLFAVTQETAVWEQYALLMALWGLWQGLGHSYGLRKLPLLFRSEGLEELTDHRSDPQKARAAILAIPYYQEISRWTEQEITSAARALLRRGLLCDYGLGLWLTYPGILCAQTALAEEVLGTLEREVGHTYSMDRFSDIAPNRHPGQGSAPSQEELAAYPGKVLGGWAEGEIARNSWKEEAWDRVLSLPGLRLLYTFVQDPLDFYNFLDELVDREALMTVDTGYSEVLRVP